MLDTLLAAVGALVAAAAGAFCWHIAAHLRGTPHPAPSQTLPVPPPMGGDTRAPPVPPNVDEEWTPLAAHRTLRGRVTTAEERMDVLERRMSALDADVKRQAVLAGTRKRQLRPGDTLTDADAAALAHAKVEQEL